MSRYRILKTPRYLAAAASTTIPATATAFLKQARFSENYRFSSPQMYCILTNLYPITGYRYHYQVASAFVTPCQIRRSKHLQTKRFRNSCH